MQKLFILFTLLCASLSMMAQVTVSGEVKDSSGEPVIGANVVVKGMSMGVATDIDGKFNLLNVPKNSIIRITSVGYSPQEIEINNGGVFNIVLSDNLQALDEVVVIGYGTQRKGDVTASVASVKAEDFNKGSIKDVGQLIQGKVAGLAITNSSGDPTSSTQVRLRGTNTISGANTAPLVLIDGIPGDFGTVAPEDVESVDVLKDGSAAAIYGTRGTNGVILITTRQAKSREYSRVDYHGYVSTERISKKLEMLSASQFRELYPNEDFGSETNWFDEITRTPFSHVHNLSLQGGTNRTNYIASISYSDRQGIMKHSDAQAFNGRVEITQRLFDDKLTLKFGLIGRQTNWHTSAAGTGFNTSAYAQATRRNPTEPVYNEDGTYFERVGKFEYENPVSLLEEGSGINKKTFLRANGNVIFRPIKDLTFNLLVSYLRNSRNYYYQETHQHISALRDGRNGYVQDGADFYTDKLLEFTAQWNKRIGKNSFTILAGYSYDETSTDGLYFNNYNFQDDYFGGAYNADMGQALKDGKAYVDSWRTDTNLIGFFGRATYSFDDKYMLMGAVRYEGASQLWGTDHVWGFFPSISAGWRITQESFMENQDIFNDLKLRAGYGVTGSQPSSSFLGVSMLTYGGYAYVNGKWINTIVPASNPNPDLRWEEKKEFNVGLDWTSLHGVLSGTIDFYDRKVDGLLYSYNVPTPPNLVNSTMANGGTMRNRGLEILVSVRPFQTKDFDWSTTVTWSYNSNKLESLDGSIFKSDNDYFDTGWAEYSGQGTVSHRVQVGEPIGNFWGFKVVDVTEDGKWIYEDGRNGELVDYDHFDHSGEAKQVIGNGLPKFYASWNNNFRYRNFDLSINMRGAFGFDIINAPRCNYENTKNSRVENRLTTTTRKIFGKVPLSKEVEPEFNSYYVEKGDYWKIDDITLGYTLPKFSKYIQNLRIYGSIHNLCTITSYEGVDPEVDASGLTPGYDGRWNFPTTRSYTLGLNITF